MLVAYAESEVLPDEQARVIETHLADCSQCSDAVDAVSIDLESQGSMDSAPPPKQCYDHDAFIPCVTHNNELTQINF